MEEKSTKSAEDYLESILMLSEKKEFVRSIDVAQELNVTKPSVSIATKKLREREFINVDLDGRITLTESGREIADMVYSKHKLISNLLKYIGVDEETAVKEACLIEHVISDSTYSRLNEFYARMEKKN